MSFKELVVWVAVILLLVLTGLRVVNYFRGANDSSPTEYQGTYRIALVASEAYDTTQHTLFTVENDDEELLLDCTDTICEAVVPGPGKYWITYGAGCHEAELPCTASSWSHKDPMVPHHHCNGSKSWEVTVKSERPWRLIDMQKNDIEMPVTTPEFIYRIPGIDLSFL